MASPRKQYVWKPAHELPFDEQFPAFLRSLDDYVLSPLFQKKTTYGDADAAKIPGIGTAAVLNKFVFKGLSKLAETLQDSRSDEDVRAACLDSIEKLMDSGVYGVQVLVQARELVRAAFSGSVTLLTMETWQRVTSVRYNRKAGVNAFLSKLNQHVTAFELNMGTWMRDPDWCTPLPLLLPVLYELPPPVLQVINDFLAPCDNLSITDPEADDIKRASLPKLVEEIKKRTSPHLLNPQPAGASSATAPTASLPSVAANSVATAPRARGKSHKCAFHRSNGHSLSDCVHYAEYIRAGQPKIGQSGFDTASSKWLKAKSSGGSPAKGGTFKTHSLAVVHSSSVVSVNSSGSVTSPAGPTAGHRFGIDTHTTHHVVQDLSLLDNFKRYDEPLAVCSLSEEPRAGMSVVGEGDLTLRFNPPGVSPCVVTFTGVRLIESASPDKGLILLKAESFAGTHLLPAYLTTAKPPRLVFQHQPKESHIPVMCERGQFFLPPSLVEVSPPSAPCPVPPPEQLGSAVNSSLAAHSESLASLNESRKVTLQRWHQRFAHVSLERTKRELSSQGITAKPGAPPELCGPCVYKASSKPILSSASSKKRKASRKSKRKSKAKPVSSNSVELDEDAPTLGLLKASEIVTDGAGSDVEIDLRKPGQVTLVDIKVQKTDGGNSLWLVFVDAATNHVHVELLPSKSSANICTAIDNYLVKYGQFVQRGDFIHSDSEKTFLSREVAAHLARNGQRPINLEASPPFTQQLNGKVERLAGIVNKHADCVFEHFQSFVKTRLPSIDYTRLHMLAFQHSAAVFNRLAPSRGGKSPDELMFGRPPPHSELRVFGSLAYINYTKAQAAIHGKKKEPAIYVGFSSVNSSHTLYCPRTKVLRHSIMVDIDEDFSTADFFAAQVAEAATSLHSVMVEESGPHRLRAAAVQYVSVNATNTSRSITLKEATSPENKDDYKAAVAKEAKSFQTKQVFASYHDCSDLERFAAAKDFEKLIMRSITSIKYDINNVPIKLKVRNVIDGSEQGHVSDNYSHVLISSSMRMLAAVAVHLGLILKQADYETAYLNSVSRNRNIFVRMPDDLMAALGTTKRYARLHKTVYGLKQASAEWYNHLSNWLKSKQFVPIKSDPCVFKAPDSLGTCFIGISTDDLMIAVDTEDHYRSLLELLNTDHVVKDLGNLEWYLGIAFHQDLVAGTVTLDQAKYIETLALEYKVTQSRAVRTVLPVELPTVADSPSTPQQHRDARARPYLQCLGAINFVATNTRPDIAMAVSYLGSFSQCHGLKHWDALMHLLRYLYFTREEKLTYRYQDDVTNANVMSVYTDSGYASCDPLQERGQYSGYVSMLNGAAIDWKARRVGATLSTTEAEYIALCLGGREACHGKQKLKELGFEATSPTVIYSDNNAAITIAKSKAVTQLNKHFDIQLHWIRNKVADNWFDVQRCDTSIQPADIFTKNLPVATLAKHRHTVLGLNH